MPPEFKLASDSLFSAMHDPARAPWVLERLRPILAKFPNHAPFRQIEFWALANTGASVATLAALTDSLIGGVSASGREQPGRLQQATHCLELGQVLFARRESLAMAESYVRRAIQHLEPTHPASLREACEDLLAQIARARDAAAPDTLRFPSPSNVASAPPNTSLGDGAPAPISRALWDSNLAGALLSAVVAILAVLLAQWLRDRADTRRTRERLITRIRTALESTVRTLDSVISIKADGTKEFDPQSMQGIILAWNRYDRVSDDLDLLENARDAEQIENILEAAREVAEAALEDERRFKAETRFLGEPAGHGVAVSQQVIDRQQEQRRKRIGLIQPVLDGARRVLEAFNTRWRPATWHKVAASVDSDWDSRAARRNKIT
jgi:hypothetical protein